MSVEFGIWAMKGGDEHARSGFNTIDEALAYAGQVPLAGVVSGMVTVFPSAGIIPSWGAIPVGVLLEVNDKGTRTLWASGGQITSSSRRRNLRSFGAVGNGTADDTSAIMAAYNSLPAYGGILEAEDGVFKHTSQLLFNTKRVVIEGYGPDVVWNGTPTCKFLNASTATFGMIFMQDRSGMDGVAYVGQAGTVNGIQFLNNSCFLRRSMIAKMGQDGVWWGDNSATAGTYNLNCWYMEDVGVVNNGRDGMLLSCRDSFNAGNANAGVANRVNANLNGRNGVRIRDAGKNAWNGLLTEANVNEGLYLLGMAHQNVFLGGDNEGNFVVATLPTVQIKISNEEGAGHIPISCAFYEIGLNAGQTFVDQGIHTKFYASDYPFPMPNAMVGAISTNADNGSGTPPLDGVSGRDTIYHGVSDQGGERIRFGVVKNGGVANNLLAAQVVADITAGLYLAARGTSGGGLVKLLAGLNHVCYAQLADSLGFETNRSVNVVGGATGYFVGGTRVVTGRQAAVTAPTGGTVIDTQSRTAINDLIARLQAHGLIT